jgi:hypothetical protein
VLLQDGFEGGRLDGGVSRQMVDDVGQVGEEVALVLVRQDGGHASVVELDILIGHADEVHGGVLGHQGDEGFGDELGDFALWFVSITYAMHRGVM